MASPSPSTDIITSDFVMLRRRKTPLANFDEPDFLQHSSQEISEEKAEVKGRAKGKRTKRKPKVLNGSGQGNKWVKFLDVALECPSDESDDELSFCKPSWTKSETVLKR
jgi:hypothetical protein